jgi:uncharacterized protein (TIGR00730 family)
MTEQLTPRRRSRYNTGDPALDARIAELIEVSGLNEDADLLQDMLTSCFRLARDRADRGEMKLVNAALKEFVYAFRVFKEYRAFRKVSIFGSARSLPSDPNYEYARRFARAIAERGWMVITGAGPGIMAAGHQGAGAEHSFGAAIRLPMEIEPNMYIEGDPKLITFKYFFTRKVIFLKESDAFVLFPGGFGTLDEMYELLTLMQTGKSDIHPIVLIEAPGGDYWADWLAYAHQHLVGRGLISREDLYLIKCTHEIDEAVEEILTFYRNYHSQRYVAGRLVLRVQRLPPPEALEELARTFADILLSPEIVPVPPSEQEAAEGDFPELKRLRLDFNRGNFGRLRQLIDELNRY